MLLLVGKIGKHIKFVVTFLSTLSTQFPPFFSSLEPGTKPKLAHAYYVFRCEVKKQVSSFSFVSAIRGAGGTDAGAQYGFLVPE